MKTKPPPAERRLLVRAKNLPNTPFLTTTATENCDIAENGSRGREKSRME